MKNWNENQDIAKNVPLFGCTKLKIGAKVERKLRYCEKRSTSADKAGFQGILVSVLTVAFQKKGKLKRGYY